MAMFNSYVKLLKGVSTVSIVSQWESLSPSSKESKAPGWTVGPSRTQVPLSPETEVPSGVGPRVKISCQQRAVAAAPSRQYFSILFTCHITLSVVCSIQDAYYWLLLCVFLACCLL